MLVTDDSCSRMYAAAVAGPGIHAGVFRFWRLAKQSGRPQGEEQVRGVGGDEHDRAPDGNRGTQVLMSNEVSGRSGAAETAFRSAAVGSRSRIGLTAKSATMRGEHRGANA